MARLETRQFGNKKMLLVFPENEEESKMVDKMLGQPFVTRVTGEIKLADGYADHYIMLTGSKGEHTE